MPKRFPLQTLHDLSHLRLDDAARQLGLLVAGEHEAKKRHQLLVDYRAEYQARFVAATRSGLGTRELNNFRGFLAKLDEAIDQALSMVSQSQTRTAHGKQQWLEKRVDVKAYDTLADRHRQRELAGTLRREQQLTDEFAARRPAGDDDDGFR